jgi:divalent metal cation (Fe/Co/Zn/Cd) transporter
MIKIVLFFLMVFVGFFIGIQSIRDLTGQEKVALTKLIGYSIICAVLTTGLLTGFVLLF